MRLILLTCMTMMAFAANSVLTRAALADGRIGLADFSAIRLASAAVVLFGLVWLRGGQLDLGRPGRWRGVLALAVYVIGFSFAYVSLPAGVGALILFGTVQVTMFAAALHGSEGMPRRRLIGAAVAFCGLIWLMWPVGGAAPNLLGAGLMLLAGIGCSVWSCRDHDHERGDADADWHRTWPDFRHPYLRPRLCAVVQHTPPDTDFHGRHRTTHRANNSSGSRCGPDGGSGDDAVGDCRCARHMSRGCVVAS